MTTVLRADGLGKTYGRRPALADCTLDVPAGRVVGLIGPNGAGKSTLLNLAVGMLKPTSGTIEVLGGTPGAGPAQLAKVGFVAQDTPTYDRLSVEDHLRLGARLNPGWDDGLARDRIRSLGLDPAERAANLSGGQRAQLALTLGVAKRPELLILDEPVASLDPLARREFLQDLMEAVAEHELSVVLSSHLVSDVERVCDYLIVLVASRVRLADLSTTSGNSFLDRLAAERTDGAVYYVGSAAVLALPAIIGVFWGAPLVARELEAGTHRLVWSQTVTRSRWLATKVGFTTLAAVAAAGALSLMVTWWSGPIDHAIANGQAADRIFDLPRLSPWMFAARGITPIGYAAFALALAAGLVIRRTVPAMAVTLAVQIVMPIGVRAHLAPARLNTTITATNLKAMIIGGAGSDGPVVDLTVDIGKPGAWIISNQTLDHSGHVVGTLPSWVSKCGAPPGEPEPAGQAACLTRLAQLGYRQGVTYQPAGRYWALQAYETAIFLALAGLLTGFCFWWLRHRVS